MTPTENNNPLHPDLERAVSEMRNEANSLDPAVIEAAAARVWSHLASEVAAAPGHDDHGAPPACTWFRTASVMVAGSSSTSSR